MGRKNGNESNFTKAVILFKKSDNTILSLFYVLENIFDIIFIFWSNLFISSQKSNDFVKCIKIEYGHFNFRKIEKV